MSRRTKAIFLFGGGVLIIILLMLLLLKELRRDEVTVTEGIGSVGVDIESLPVIKNPVETAQSGEVDTETPNREVASLETELTRLSASFAERFGSYSNESGFENVSDLYVLMTQSLQAWVANTYVTQLHAQHPRAEGYYNVSTKAISVKKNILDEENGIADFMVLTQRSEVEGQGTPKILYQNLALKLIRLEDTWRVDFVQWREEVKVE